MLYQNILVCVDLTERTPAILKRAKTLAQQQEATLDVVHVVEYPPIAYGEFALPLDPNFKQNLETQAQKTLSRHCERLNIAKKRQHVIPGPVKHAVIELATQLSCDLLIMGAHSHQGLERWLGSRATGILQLSQCDVLALRTL